MPQQTDQGRPDGTDAAARAAEHAAAAAQSAGLAAGAAAEALSAAAGVVADVAADRGREVYRAVRGGAELLPTPQVLEGVLEDAFERGADAWDALRGRRTRVRRWPWATGSAVLGAALAVAATVAVRRLRTPEAPGALEPEQVKAVVDAPVPGQSPVVPVPADTVLVSDAAPVGPVDEDGEAVEPLHP